MSLIFLFKFLFLNKITKKVYLKKSWGYPCYEGINQTKLNLIKAISLSLSLSLYIYIYIYIYIHYSLVQIYMIEVWAYLLIRTKSRLMLRIIWHDFHLFLFLNLYHLLRFVYINSHFKLWCTCETRLQQSDKRIHKNTKRNAMPTSKVEKQFIQEYYTQKYRFCLNS